MMESPAGARRPLEECEVVIAAASPALSTSDGQPLQLLKPIQRFLHAHPTAVPFVVLMTGVALGLSVNYSRFATADNFSTILLQVTIVGILGVAQTLIVLVGCIDLSVGVIMVISSVVMGRLGVIDGLPLILAIPAGLLSGIVFGYLNGSLVTRLKIPSFIVTLGTMTIIDSLNTFYSHSETVRSREIEDKAAFLQLMGYPIEFAGMHIILGTFMLVGLASVIWYLLNWTAMGRQIYATGDDREAARLAGIDTNRVLLHVYVLAGLASSIAGWVLIGRVGAISPASGHNANLDSITAAVIGGAGLSGGRGSVVGTLIGALIVGVFGSAVSLAGLDVLWQQLAVGVLIIVAVALDRWIRRVSG